MTSTQILRFSIKNCQQDYADVLAWISAFHSQSDLLNKMVMHPKHIHEGKEITLNLNTLPLLDEVHFQIELINSDDNSIGTDITNAIYLYPLFWQFKNHIEKIEIILDKLPDDMQYRFRDFFIWRPKLLKRFIFNKKLKDAYSPNLSAHFLPAVVVDDKERMALSSFVKITSTEFSVGNNEEAEKYILFASNVLFSKDGGRFTKSSMTTGRKLIAETFKQDISILQLLIFSCLYGKNRNLCSQKKDFQEKEKHEKELKKLALTEMEYCAELSNSLSLGVSQALENSIHHSAGKWGILSIRSHYARQNNINYAQSSYGYVYVPEVNKRVHNKTTIPFAMEISVVDINDNKTICSTFKETLEREKESNSDNMSKVNAIANLLNKDIYDEFKLLHFMKSPKSFNVTSKTNDAWVEYRKQSTGLHMGLTSLAQNVRNCNGVIKITSKSRNSSIREDVYFESSINRENQVDLQNTKYSVMPGSQISIFVPIKQKETVKKNYSSSGAQIHSSRYSETYNDYANYLTIKAAPKSLYVFDSLFIILNSINGEYKNEQHRKELALTKLGIKISEDISSNSEKRTTIFSIDFDELNSSELGNESLDIDELIIKALLSPSFLLSKFEEKIFLAICNSGSVFMEKFKSYFEAQLVCGEAEFNTKLQLFVHDSTSDEANYRGFVLFGRTFEDVVFNESLMRVSRGYSLFNEDIYNKISPTSPPASPTSILPFDSILSASKASRDAMSAKLILHKTIADISNVDYFKGGCKINSHMRLGSKIHVTPFFEVAPLFTRTDFANRMAYILLRQLQEEGILSGKILFFGYADYSRGILNAIDQILKANSGKNDISEHLIAIFQRGTQLDNPNANEIFWLNGQKIHKEQVQSISLVQIVPINSTFTTFDKMLSILGRSIIENYTDVCNWKHIYNAAFLWVRDLKGMCDEPSDYECPYWSQYKNFKITLDGNMLPSLSALKRFRQEALDVCVDIVIKSDWQDAVSCSACYPEDENNLDNESPLNETDITSTIPSQQHRYWKSRDNNYQPETDISKLEKLRGCVRYGHFMRGEKHHQFYIQTDNFFHNNSKGISDWLKSIKEVREKGKEQNEPQMTIIFAPEHFSNSGFAQYVNNYVFDATATLITIRTATKYRTNFEIELNGVANSINKFLFKIKGKDRRKYLHLCFVDDTIQTGETYLRANGLLRSILPIEVIKQPIIFDECFVLVDRLSPSSKSNLLSNAATAYHSFVHIEASLLRTHGDSCICCKLEKSYQNLFIRSTSNWASAQWAKKLNRSKMVLFDDERLFKDGDIECEGDFKRLVGTHIINVKLLKEPLAGEDSRPCLTDIVNLFEDTVWSNFLEFKNEKVLIETILKILPRPFIAFDSELQKVIYKFFILLSNSLIGIKSSDKNESGLIDKISRKIVSLYGKNEDFFNFLINYVLEGLCDLKSTYLLRSIVLEKLCEKIEDLDDKEINYRYISMLVKRLIDGHADETRSARFEADLSKTELSTCSEEFKQLLFVENGRVLYDGIEELQEKNDISDAYFLRIFKKMHKTQQEKLPADDNYYDNLLTPYREMREYIKVSAIKETDPVKRYNGLLSMINTVVAAVIPGAANINSCLIVQRSKGANYIPIVNKSESSADDAYVQTALSFVSRENKEKLMDYHTDVNNSMYQLHLKFNNLALENLSDTLKKEGVISQTLFFRSLAKICDVHLYVELTYDKTISTPSYIIDIVARTILQYRHSLMRLFETDFTTDAVSSLSQKRVLDRIVAQDRTLVHAGNQAFVSLLRAANMNGGTQAGYATMLMYINFMISRLFHNQLAMLSGITDCSPLSIWDEPYRNADGEMDTSLNSLLNTVLTDEFIHSNENTSSLSYQERLRHVFGKFKILDKNGNEVKLGDLSKHLQQFLLPQTKKGKRPSCYYTFAVIASLFVSAVKHVSAENKCDDEAILDYFICPEYTSTSVKIKLYAENVPGYNDLKYLVIENDVKRIGSKNCDELTVIEQKSYCDNENERLKNSLQNPIMGEPRINGTGSHIGFSRSAAHYFCKKVVEKIDDANVKFEAVYSIKEDGKPTFKVKLPILKGGN